MGDDALGPARKQLDRDLEQVRGKLDPQMHAARGPAIKQVREALPGLLKALEHLADQVDAIRARRLS